jgi:energy-coupling factor transporter ATP-binding protein EcfA2
MIRLKSIQIGNFRGIREGAVRDFADVNILVGRNNSGKSTVVEAIHRLATSAVVSAVDPLDRGIVVWSMARGEDRPLPDVLWYRLELNATISIVAQVGTVDRPAAETIGLTISRQGSNPTPTIQWSWGGQSGAGKDEIGNFLSRTTLFRPPDAQNSDIERRLWSRIIGPRHDKTLATAFNTVFNQNAESYTLNDQKLWVLFPKHSVPLDSQGEGNRAAVRCLMMLAVLQKTMFIAEEPGCHQHPGSLERFAQAVCKLAKDQEVQLFLSTHSVECVRSFLKASGEVRSEAAVFHLKLDDGVLDATRLLPDAALTLLDTGVDLRFLDLYG